MSQKETCPGCNSHTSDVWYSVERGDPCPYCGLSADVIIEVNALRRQREDDALADRVAAAEIRADRATAELRRLQSILDDVRRALKGDA